MPYKRRTVYRSRDQIVADILEVARKREGATQTEIMYEANLSFDQTNTYIPGMTEAKLLVKKSANNRPLVKALYTVSDEGYRFLKESPFMLGKLEIIEKVMHNIKKSKMNKDR